jgi:hypothetical protein
MFYVSLYVQVGMIMVERICVGKCMYWGVLDLAQIVRSLATDMATLQHEIYHLEKKNGSQI